ncbi:PAS domain S-box-containing protein/diguanylate cyclase (GGDEF) domain-containing protein [Oceanospirillum multiglobuliferum]|uniref:Diguanylate cyclase n=1 Tax=Oceanospirillum multiglobuliferum TaxID=64969 RepID=A0A1T4SHM6_9GAMM|nr:EAL domain-containing protein [Oceanospirillum multiglobuliferum]OPX54224.1 hypothetical protein BTE48_15265 [Oceanospirillum multiglobuliferum]SKA27687.1 PAS domain S-box-containing protein/diguanylate cyclase (GGDEF) domain-containing protein [Oceanospirillum multiglobuliferum]
MNSRAYFVNWLMMFLAMAAVVFATVYFENTLKDQRNQERALEIQSRLSEVSARIESTVLSSIVSAKGLSTYLSINQNLPPAEFEQIASIFLHNSSLISNLGVSNENYVMTRVYPLEGNETVLGLNLAQHAEQFQAAQDAMQSGLVQLSGPHVLVQGRSAFIVRIPIVNAQTKQVVGLLSFPILLHSLYQSTGVLALAEEFNIAIRTIDKGESRAVFFGSPDLFSRQHLTHLINLPGLNWQLAASTHELFSEPLTGQAWIRVLAVTLLIVIGTIQWLRLRELKSVVLIEEQQRMLDQAQRVGQIGNWSWHIPSNTVFWSDEALRLFGLPLTSSMLRDKGYLKFVHNDDLVQVQLSQQEALKAGGRYQIDFRILRLDGELRWLHSEGYVELNHEKKPIQVFGIFQDVTHGKRIERQLKQRESQLRAVTDAAQSLIMITRTQDGLVRFCNPSCQRLLGISPDALVGRSIRDFYPDPHDRELLLKQVEIDQTLNNYKLMLRRADNQKVVTFLAGLQKIHYDGEACFVVDLVDISAMLDAQAALTDSEERFRLFAEHAPGVFWLAKPDWSGVDFLSRGFDQITHMSSRDVLEGRLSFFQMIHPEDRQFVGDQLSNQGESLKQIEFRVLRPDGSIRWIRNMSFATFDAAGHVKNIAGIGEDITESNLSTQRLKLAASVFENTAEAIVVSDANNQIVSVNEAFTRITGYRQTEVKGLNPKMLSSGKQDPEFYQDMWESLRDKGRWQGEVWNKRKNGELYAEWLSITVLKNARGDVENYVAVFSDVTDRKEQEELIRYQANYDALTALPNRVLFNDRLNQAIANSKRNSTRGVVMFIDLDHFKEVNDTLGHEAGDQLLISVAERLKRATRESDTVARMGGDEFTLMLPQFTSVADAGKVAENIIEELSRVFVLGDNRAHISASIGITIFPDDAQELKRILQNADQAMYAAKSAGRRTYRFFTPAMQTEAEERQLLQNDLRHAISNKEFELHYQPIVNQQGIPVKVEALIRWVHPERGMISPDKFIPLAEETGLIIPLGLWVFETAVKQASLWQKSMPGICVAVNLSSKQISAEDAHTEHFIDIVQQYNLPSELITLEVTESLFMDPTGEPVKKLEQLRDQGFKIAIDDFGTGYSSLSYLKQLPLSIIKIDKSFVFDLDSSKNDSVLVDAILSIASSMKLEVVAEGVETQEQSAYLVRGGAQMQQGWLFSRPMPASMVEDWLKPRWGSK